MIDCLYNYFKWWSVDSGVYIISDTHFGDKDCKDIDENWITPEEHINIINKSVGKSDTLICLGDCGDLSYFKDIKADYKVLIKGNHDDGKKSRYYEIFDEVYDGPLFITPKLVLSHEPLPTMPYYLNIHGHDHSGGSHSPYHINLAANIVNYQVFNLGKEIKKGILSPIINIHRYTIDNAIKDKEKKHEDFYNS